MPEPAAALRTLTPEDAPAVAALHIAAIDTGFISSLGPAFVTTLYEHLAADRRCFGLVAERAGAVVGFLALTDDVAALYRAVLRRGGLRFARLLLGRALTGGLLRRIWQTLRYPQRGRGGDDLPRAELLALAVAEAHRGRGIGRALVETGLDVARRRGLDALKLCVGAERRAALGLYAALGFRHARDLDSHGRRSHLYVRDLHA